MIIIVETIVLCLIFTIMVYVMSRNPIKTLYNYPPKVQDKIKLLEEYKDQIPTTKDMISTKLGVAATIVIVVSLIMRYVNGYTMFIDAFSCSLIIWTIVNIYDVLVLDCIWFCHSKKFIFKGTEDITNEYRNYWFHIKEGLIGEVIGIIVCLLSSLIVTIL